MFRNALSNKFGSSVVSGNTNNILAGGGMIGPNAGVGSTSALTGLNSSNAYNSFIDDSIGSFMGSLTPTRIDSSPLHGQR